MQSASGRIRPGIGFRKLGLRQSRFRILALVVGAFLGVAGTVDAKDFYSYDESTQQLVLLDVDGGVTPLFPLAFPPGITTLEARAMTHVSATEIVVSMRVDSSSMGTGVAVGDTAFFLIDLEDETTTLVAELAGAGLVSSLGFFDGELLFNAYDPTPPTGGGPWNTAIFSVFPAPGNLATLLCVLDFTPLSIWTLPSGELRLAMTDDANPVMTNVVSFDPTTCTLVPVGSSPSPAYTASTALSDATGVGFSFDAAAGAHRLVEFSLETGALIEDHGPVPAGLSGLLVVPENLFVRGDTNLDGAVNLDDAVFLLEYLFDPMIPTIACEASGDTNDDGLVDIGDPIFIMNALFMPGSPAIPDPSGECGLDWETPDTLLCELGSC